MSTPPKNIKVSDRGQTRPITSREYKLILSPLGFSFGIKDAQNLWQALTPLIEEASGIITKEQMKVKHRITHYLDTPDFAFRRAGTVLRLRETINDDDKKNPFKFTLKNRLRDRYLASNLDIVPGQNGDVKTKFEEDITPNKVMYSYSGSSKTKHKPQTGDIKGIRGVFYQASGLEAHGNTEIVIVNNRKFYEECFWLGQVKFDNGHKVKFSLTNWFAHSRNEPEGFPLISELSFDYDLIEKEDSQENTISSDEQWDESQIETFHIPTVTGAHKLYNLILSQNAWVHKEGTTKTAFAYQI